MWWTLASVWAGIRVVMNHEMDFSIFLAGRSNMTTVADIDAQQLITVADNQSDQSEMAKPTEGQVLDCENQCGVCAICLNEIVLQETALVKGCEHAYCVTCILRWATYKDNPTCPQCKHPFEFLNIHRSLDGSIHDYMFEESVCLLLRASWFKPLIVEDHKVVEDEFEDLHLYSYSYQDDEDDDLDEDYFNGSLSLRIGNRRWGDNGYVRSGRQEARPAYRPNVEDSAGSSRESRKKEATPRETVGRRAKRALKREAADKAAAVKHQQHLARFGRK